MTDINYSAYTDKGKERKRNEDAFFAASVGGNAFFAVVCDGMGGENAGNIASELAVSEIASAVMKNSTSVMSEGEIKQIFSEAFPKANRAVRKKAASSPDFSGMGTTAIAVFVSDGKAVFAHVGDSRAYAVSGGEIKRLTVDHSLVEELAREGIITAEEAETHPDKNIITRAVGADVGIETEFDTVELKKGDCLLLCSDGLSNYVDQSRIAGIISDNPVETAARLLVDEANLNGGGDNITAVVYTEIEDEKNGN